MPSRNWIVGLRYWSRPSVVSESFLAASGEEQQRRRRRRAEADQPDVGRERRRRKAGRAAAPPPRHRGDRGRREDHRLERQPFERAERRDLAQQAVGAEAEAEDEADPRQPPRAHRQPDDAGGGDAERDPLRAARPLAEQAVAEADVDQRRDEVAEARLDDVAVRDRPDVGHPVGRQQQGAGDEARHHAARAQRRAEPRPARLPGQDDRHEQQRPDDPVGEHLGRKDAGLERGSRAGRSPTA